MGRGFGGVLEGLEGPIIYDSSAGGMPAVIMRTSSIIGETKKTLRNHVEVRGEITEVVGCTRN